MKDNTLLAIVAIAKSLVAGIAVSGGIYLAYHGIKGWGWFVFIGVCMSAYSIKTNDNKSSVDD